MADDRETELMRDAQRAGELRLTACEAAMDEDDALDDDLRAELDRVVAPFCGCTTCVVREVLSAAWPHMVELARLEVDGE